ncbi:MAG: SUMF1/EgtB/PvdO family nonheme iron enzyme, partial [Gammaproteobacteria bacterium]
LERTAFLVEAELADIAQSVFRGLKEVHRHEYLHRDIKPSNIYLRRNGEAVLIDFGAARQALGNYTHSLTGIVSPGYAPSEQYGGDANKQGPWTDLYGVGATLYRCISGRSPVDATSRMYALMEGKKDPLVPAIEIGAGRYSAKWLHLIDWLLCPAGKDRPQSVDAVLTWLEGNAGSAVEPDPATVSKTMVLEKAPPPAQRETRHRNRNDAGKGRTPRRSDEGGAENRRDRRRALLGSIGARRAGWSLAGLLLTGLVVSGVWWLWGPTGEDEPAFVNPGALFLSTEPADARVRFKDDKHRYHAGMKIAPGNYAFEVSREGYRPSEVHVAIEAGREKRLTVTLSRVEPEKPKEPSVDRPPRIAILPELVKIEPGCFEMGSADDEAGRSKTERRHRVCVSGFSLGKYEVTVKEFRRFVEATAFSSDAEKGIGGKGCTGFSKGERQSAWAMLAVANWREPNGKDVTADDRPVTCVSWNDANAYIRWLNRESGEHYRLPTEAEWEYAARAGVRGAGNWGKNPKKACDHGNGADRKAAAQLSGWPVHGCDDGFAGLAPAGHYARNPFGLYDMTGNVWEWTCSGVDLAYHGGEQHCAPFSGTWHILRGGSWADSLDTLRLSYRGRNASAFRSDTLGFRVAL